MILLIFITFMFNFAYGYIERQQYPPQFWEILYQYPSLESALLGTIIRNDYKSFKILCKYEPFSASVYQNLILARYSKWFDSNGPFSVCGTFSNSDTIQDAYDYYLSVQYFMQHEYIDNELNGNWQDLHLLSSSNISQVLLMEPIQTFKTYYTNDLEKDLIEQNTMKQAEIASELFYNYDKLKTTDNANLLVYNYLKASTNTDFQIHLTADLFIQLQEKFQLKRLKQISQQLSLGYELMQKSNSINKEQALKILNRSIQKADHENSQYWAVVSVLINSGTQINLDVFQNLLVKYCQTINSALSLFKYFQSYSVQASLNPVNRWRDYQNNIPSSFIEEFVQLAINLPFLNFFTENVLQLAGFKSNLEDLIQKADSVLYRDGQEQVGVKFADEIYSNIMLFGVSLFSLQQEHFRKIGYQILGQIPNHFEFEDEYLKIYLVLKSILESGSKIVGPQTYKLLQKTILAFKVQLKVIQGIPEVKLVDTSTEKNAILIREMVKEGVVSFDNVIEYEITRVDGPIYGGNSASKLERDRWLRLNGIDPQNQDQVEQFLINKSHSQDYPQFRDCCQFQTYQRAVQKWLQAQ